MGRRRQVALGGALFALGGLWGLQAAPPPIRLAEQEPLPDASPLAGDGRLTYEYGDATRLPPSPLLRLDARFPPLAGKRAGETDLGEAESESSRLVPAAQLLPALPGGSVPGGGVEDGPDSPLERQLERFDRYRTPQGVAGLLARLDGQGVAGASGKLLDGAVGMTDEMLQSLVDAGLDQVEQAATRLPFVRGVRLGYRTPFAGREDLLEADLSLALLDRERNAVLGQLGLQMRDGEPAFNVGLAYRVRAHAPVPEGVILGVNFFYDYLADPEVSRYSFGFEARSPHMTGYLNVYRGLGDEPQADGSIAYSPNGWDLGLSGRVPMLPWLELAATHYRWSLHGLDVSGQNSLTGQHYEIRLEPMPLFSVDVEYDTGGRGSGWGVQAQMEYRFGVPFGEQVRLRRLLADADAGRPDAWSRRFERVQREYEQRVQYRLMPAAVTAPLVSIGAETTTFNEGGSGEMTLRISRAVSEDVTVMLSISGTAERPAIVSPLILPFDAPPQPLRRVGSPDYSFTITGHDSAAVGDVVVIPAGGTEVVIRFTARADILGEPDETITLAIEDISSDAEVVMDARNAVATLRVLENEGYNEGDAAVANTIFAEDVPSVDVGVDIPARLEVNTDFDVFRITLTDERALTVASTAQTPGLDLEVLLVDARGRHLAADSDSGNATDFLVQRTLPAGIYFAIVYDANGRIGTYSLATTMPEVTGIVASFVSSDNRMFNEDGETNLGAVHTLSLSEHSDGPIRVVARIYGTAELGYFDRGVLTSAMYMRAGAHSFPDYTISLPGVPGDNRRVQYSIDVSVSPPTLTIDVPAGATEIVLQVNAVTTMPDGSDETLAEPIETIVLTLDEELSSAAISRTSNRALFTIAESDDYDPGADAPETIDDPDIESYDVTRRIEISRGLHSEHDVDVYRVQLPRSGTLTVTLVNQRDINLEAELLDEEGRLLTSDRDRGEWDERLSDPTEITDEQFEIELQRGSYFILVNAYDGGIGSYILSTRFREAGASSLSPPTSTALTGTGE